MAQRVPREIQGLLIGFRAQGLGLREIWCVPLLKEDSGMMWRQFRIRFLGSSLPGRMGAELQDLESKPLTLGTAPPQ